MKDYATPLVLAGGYCCDLTASERNRWDEHALSLPEHAEYFRAYACLQAAIRQGDPDGTAIRADIYLAAVTAMYLVAKAWAERVIAERPKEIAP